MAYRALVGCKFNKHIAMAMAALAWLPFQANADTTLSRIYQTRQIQLGYAPDKAPFSDLDEQKKPIGYAIDLCKTAVKDMGKQIGAEIQINWVRVDTKTRFDLMDVGRIDRLCADTTNTVERQKKYNFSYSFFVSGTRILMNKKYHVADINGLDGQRIAVIAGTTGASLVRYRVGRASIIAVKDLDEAWDLLENGKVDGIGYDDILLAERYARSKVAANQYDFLMDYVSVEPYGLMARKADKDLINMVNRSLSQLYFSKEIYRIYDRWFVNEARHIPVGHILREDFLTPNNYPAYP